MRESVIRVAGTLDRADLSYDGLVADLLAETYARRSMDLSGLGPAGQAELITSRALNLIPGEEALTALIAGGRPLVVKYGIDPTSPDVHLGHAVPIVLASRFQRMGHRVVFIIGDVTAKIGDPSGQAGDRPPLTDAEIAANLSTYQRQVSPFIDVGRAELRFNGSWLGEITLPRLLEIAARVPVSMSLQRDDFRNRLAAGTGLSTAEFLYSIVMALDSVAITADIELGGVDQLLNLQMCRKVMEVSGQVPELVVTTPLIEGTDGTGAKMSKSKGNYLALTASPDDVYGGIMSIPDRLTVPYLRSLTEWTDPEIAALGGQHPMAVKRLLAGDIVAALHGLEAAAAARAEFGARFSRRSFAGTRNLPELSLAASGTETLGTLLTRDLGFAESMNALRRTAKGNGLRLVRETAAGQESEILPEEAVYRTLAEVAGDPEGLYVKAGRKVARIVR
ncbi:tyrosine--tRNA ligase [Longispora albida]|uniref:tyrosine--tRNA ligase n=1 Tax=Longispora albida TaxID=203523 RepID=UPI001B7FCDA2|nr:tyrosine--tRNA ligase [Longispora albida]